MAILASLTSQAFTAGGGSLGPWANPGGNGVRITIDRTSLIAGSLLAMIIRYSYNNGGSWEQQGTLVLNGGVVTDKNGITQPNTIIQCPWQNTAAGVLVPTHIRVDLLISQSFTAAAVLVETM